MNKFKKLPWAEIIPVTILYILFYSLLSKFAIPRTYHSDVIWYLDAAYNDLGDFLIWVNRYAHVYLLKVFFLFSSDPFEVGKNYWVFVFSSSSLFVYLNARILTARSNFVHGLLALCFFFSINIFSATIGIPLVDYSSMLIVLLVSFVFLLSLRKEHEQKGLLILLGFLFFLAFKTKETAWVSSVLLLGTAFDSNNTFSLNALKKNAVPILYGAGVGVFLFMILDGLFMKDIFYGLRPSHLFSSASFFTGAKPHLKNPGNWYDNVVFQNFPYLLIFALISTVKQKKHAWPIANRLFWTIPLLLIFAITVPQLTANYDLFLYRFLFPGLAMLSITAPQFIEFDVPETKKDLIIFWISLVVGGFILKGVWTGTIIFADLNAFDHPQLINSFFRPLLFTALLLLVILFDKYRSCFVFIPVFLIIGFLIQPIKKNHQSLTIHEEIYTVQPRFSPFLDFKDYIEFSPDMLMYISPNLTTPDYYLSDNVDTVSAAFDLVFQVHSGRDNFTYRPNLNSLADRILEKELDYLFLHSTDWNSLPKDLLLEVCEIHEDKEEIIVFLSCQ